MFQSEYESLGLSIHAQDIPFKEEASPVINLPFHADLLLGLVLSPGKLPVIGAAL
jgi:hypothetical protein